MATYCAVCGAPVNHDRFVCAGSEPQPLGPELDWLNDVVAIHGRKVLRGSVDDNHFYIGKKEGPYVGGGLGDGDALTLHAACWEILGKPKADKGLPLAPENDPRRPDRHGATWSDAWADIRPYMQQLFDFEGARRDGQHWLLDNPAAQQSLGGERNRARIERILEFVPQITNGVDVEQVQRRRELIAQGTWQTVTTGAAIAQFRDRLAAYDQQNYPHLIRVDKPYPALDSGLPKPIYAEFLSSFTASLRRCVEPDGNSLVAAAVLKGGVCMYLIYAREVQATLGTIRKMGELDMPSAATLALSEDSAWSAAHEVSLEFSASRCASLDNERRSRRLPRAAPADLEVS